MRKFLDVIKELKIFPVFVSDKFLKIQNNNIHLIGDAFFAFPPSFAQGASQSIESAYELFVSLNTNKEIVWQHTSYLDGDEEELYEEILKL